MVERPYEPTNEELVEKFREIRERMHEMRRWNSLFRKYEKSKLRIYTKDGEKHAGEYAGIGFEFSDDVDDRGNLILVYLGDVEISLKSFLEMKKIKVQDIAAIYKRSRLFYREKIYP